MLMHILKRHCRVMIIGNCLERVFGLQEFGPASSDAQDKKLEKVDCMSIRYLSMRVNNFFGFTVPREAPLWHNRDKFSVAADAISTSIEGVEEVRGAFPGLNVIDAAAESGTAVRDDRVSGVEHAYEVTAGEKDAMAHAETVRELRVERVSMSQRRTAPHFLST